RAPVGWAAGRAGACRGCPPAGASCTSRAIPGARSPRHGARDVGGGRVRSTISSSSGEAMTTAVYPGTFDPLTRGHEDILRRASGLFETIVVGVADSRGKHPFFTLAERIDMARAVLAPYSNVA